MSSVSTVLRNPDPTKSQVSGYTTSVQRNQLSSSFFGSNQPSLKLKAAKAKSNRVQGTRWRSVGGCPVTASTQTFDVVVVGAEIIGLSIARQFLLDSDLTVAAVDAALPCSGATGAGQGYIWMAHKIPGTETWNLAARSQQLWQMLADGMQDEGVDPLDQLGWKNTGHGISETRLNILPKFGVRVAVELREAVQGHILFRQQFVVFSYQFFFFW